jgi:hypothetical protein
MKYLKIILFVEFITLLIVGLIHLVLFVAGYDFPLIIYLMMSLFTLGICLINIFLIAPCVEWFIDKY